MPLTWQIDRHKPLVIATAEGTLVVEDFEKALDEITKPATLSYRKLIDLAQCSPDLDTADLLELSARIGAQGSMVAMGALAGNRIAGHVW